MKNNHDTAKYIAKLPQYIINDIKNFKIQR